MNELLQSLYLIADEIRGMATIGKHFAGNVYEVERADRLLELAVRVAALAESRPREEVRAIFDGEPWHRASPAMGADALVLNPHGQILLIQRKDNGRWAMPGGIAEIGHTPAESALKELWEEAGLRGRVSRLLGVFDNRLWNVATKVHMINFTFLVECDDFAAAPGIEMLDAQFFPTDALPAEMHSSHDRRVPRCLHALRDGTTYFDPATSFDADLPMHQRVLSAED